MAAWGRIDFSQEKINESHHMENAWVFPSISHSMGKCNRTHLWGESGKLVIIISYSMGTFFPFDSHPMVYFIIWEMHGFSHQFLIVRENATKTHRMGKTWEIGNHTFPIVLGRWNFLLVTSY